MEALEQTSVVVVHTVPPTSYGGEELHVLRIPSRAPHPDGGLERDALEQQPCCHPLVSPGTTT